MVQQQKGSPWQSWCSFSTHTELYTYKFSSVQFSHSVVSNSLWPHGLQHARPPCPSPTPRVYLNPCPLSQWGHPTTLSSVVPFSSRLQSFPASGSFLMSQFFASGGQSIRFSASTSVLPLNIQDWSPLGWTGWISLQSKGLSKSLLQHHSSKASIFQHSAFIIVQFSHINYTHINITPIYKDNLLHTTWSASWEICMQVRKQQLELDMEQQTGSK